MWILPENLKKSFLSAQGCEDLNPELNELALMLESNATWKGKHSLSKTWFSRWNKVYWLQHLYSRILPNSLQNTFTTKYTASLEDIRVSRSPWPASVPEQMTPDTCGHTSAPSSMQLDLFGASSKMYPGTSPSDTSRSDLTYKALVTRLRKDYSQRKKLALRTRESDSSSSQWPTPRSSEWKGTGPKGSKSQKYRLQKKYLDATVEQTDGQPLPDNLNTPGKRLVLNPAWVLQLIGTTLEKTFFAWREMPLYSKPHNSPSHPS